MEKKKITVWKNGKHIGFSQRPQKNKKLLSNSIRHKESLDQDDSIRMIARPVDDQHKIKQFPIQRKGHIRTFKPFIIATISALVIGTSLGIMMLNMITNVNHHVNQTPSQTIAPLPEEDVNKDGDEKIGNEQISSVSLDAISAYVLQGGVFSERENAETSAKVFGDAGFPTSIWSRENNYYLIVGIANTKEKAQEIGIELDQHDLETFVKEWHTKEMDLQLSEEEHTWLTSFVNVWNNSLDSVDNLEEFSLDTWKELANNFPSNTSVLAHIGQQLNEMNQEDITSSYDMQHVLLLMWRSYEELDNGS